MTGICSLLIIYGFCLGWLELCHRLRPSSPLQLKTFDWKVFQTKAGIRIDGWVEIYNPHPRMEVMVPEIQIKPRLLGKKNLDEVKVISSITSAHPDEPSREDSYWEAYIIKSKNYTKANISLDLTFSNSQEIKLPIDNVWIDIDWVNYGPFGRVKRRDGVIIPINRPKALAAEKAYFQQFKDWQLLPIKTHMLGTQDEIVNTIAHYTEQLLQKEDVLTIGETPLAVMQGRYHHPCNLEISWLSRNLCRAFHPTSSLATACGMQSLIDLVGPSRVITAWIFGVFSRFIGIRGVFYQLAGDQARLIDDITGTTAPYDQTIVLGPRNPRQVCDQISKRLGIGVAIVDVNDLGRVKVLAASRQCNLNLIKKALKPNPAGNANQQTPLVIIRPNRNS